MFGSASTAVPDHRPRLNRAMVEKSENSMRTLCVDPLTDPLWQRLVARYRSDVFHSLAWLRVLADTYGWEARAYLLCDEAGEPTAGIPFYRVTDIMGQRTVILPFSDYCDPLISDEDAWRRLSDELLAEQCAVTLRCLHNDIPLADRRFTLVKQARWHGINLKPDLDTLWSGLASASKRSINKAQRDDVVVQVAQGKQELRAFFDMHLRTRKHKYHLLAQPYAFFENIWRHFIDVEHGVLLLAVHHGEIIGGTLYLVWKDTLYYKANASASTGLLHRPNDLLLWEGIRYGKAKGYSYLDLGLSDWDQQGLIQFKRKYASDEKAISFLQHVPDAGPTQQERQGRALLPQLTALFTDESVPDPVTEKAGEILYRYFAG
jgi:CelD/BcsL family acetyltransferase involved in cellulose biosynthesis